MEWVRLHLMVFACPSGVWTALITSLACSVEQREVNFRLDESWDGLDRMGSACRELNFRFERQQVWSFWKRSKSEVSRTQDNITWSGMG